jgi:hypothetical protein
MTQQSANNFGLILIEGEKITVKKKVKGVFVKQLIEKHNNSGEPSGRAID